jgi:hypothetical protein
MISIPNNGPEVTTMKGYLNLKSVYSEVEGGHVERLLRD